MALQRDSLLEEIRARDRRASGEHARDRAGERGVGRACTRGSRPPIDSQCCPARLPRPARSAWSRVRAGTRSLSLHSPHALMRALVPSPPRARAPAPPTHAAADAQDSTSASAANEAVVHRSQIATLEGQLAKARADAAAARAECDAANARARESALELESHASSISALQVRRLSARSLSLFVCQSSLSLLSFALSLSRSLALSLCRSLSLARCLSHTTRS
jgi:hypothetical protein